MSEIIELWIRERVNIERTLVLTLHLRVILPFNNKKIPIQNMNTSRVENTKESRRSKAMKNIKGIFSNPDTMSIIKKN